MAADRQWLLESLRKSLEALALPGPLALKRMPHGTVRADELALGFDNFYTAFCGNFGSQLSQVQLDALAEVDRLLSDMSGSRNAPLWEDQAVIEHPRWLKVRNAARVAMDRLGWAVPDA